ncbi:uncharacterized protein LOC112342775 [Selaginella moellendorffii]|uniref:uncharacterized protein LOC112342775 n=1 Tax=Selaginella moellendorffii TaxID=88036 RepID=UPI000D1CB943|nr:uncharacterized protein LOC112342775 [Selaginella moellendorffii]|eukprot:XP_024520854.1 uncharacterized protein LOC112342775 [Selaginella moellendorffii]
MASSIKEQRRRLDDLPDELLVRIISRLLSSHHLHCCALVSKRWKDLARRVTHFCLDSSSPAAEEGLVRWFHPDQGSNLHFLEIKRFPRVRKNVCSTRWLGVVGKTVHSLSIWGTARLKFEDFWSSVSACQELRCLHIYADVGTTMTPPPLLNLLFCDIRRTSFTVSAMQQLLNQCTSLVYLWLGTLVTDPPGTSPLSSHSLDCLEIDDCGGGGGGDGGGGANVVLAIDMPKLRWLFISSVSMPCVELRPSTWNVEWVWLHGRVRYSGLSHSSNKLRSITLGNSFRNSANVMERVLPLLPILGGVKDLSVLVGDHDFQPRSFNLAALLELFQGLEVVRIARSSIKALSLDEWSNRKAPLVVHIETAYRSEIGGSWEADDVEFVWELLSSSDCVRLLDLTGFVYSNEPPDFQPQVPAAFEELSQAFPGRVKLHPLLFDLHPKCGMLTRAFATRVKAEPPYTAIQHWCKRMHSMETPAIESCAWQ